MPTRRVLPPSRHLCSLRWLCLAVSLLGTGGGLTAHAAVPEHPKFNRDIRPILSNNCFYCHGPDEKKREAGRRLDQRDGALAEIDGMRAIVPGKPDESELLVRIQSHDKDEVMPPPKSKKPRVSEEQVATLRRWIEQGAEYEAHWAFLPLDRSAPPVVQDKAWAKNPLDQYILARLESEGIQPSPEADAATLCRRLFLDLTGLLPSPEELADFVVAAARDRDAAVGALADRLLASPHYGERWGRHWLDQARYADSNGYTIDNARAMWPYRDWVIRSLNDDEPFDRFTVEQLAGDLLPSPTRSQIVATAFHRNTLINEEGGTDKEQFRNEAVVDRVNTTGAVWLGLTVGCAQCHSHKFDPISHREYYEMFAFFNQGTDVNNKGETLAIRRGEMFGQAVLPAAPAQSGADDLALQAAWEKAELVRSAAPPSPAAAMKWKPLKYLEYDTAAGAGFQLLSDNSLLADGRGAFNDTYRVVAQSDLKRITAVRLRALTHESLPQQGPGLAKNGNFVLTDFTISAGGVEQGIGQALADHEQPGFPASNAIDDNPKSGWAINVGKGAAGQMNATHEAVFILAQPLAANAGQLEFKLRHDLNQNYLIGRFALEVSETTPDGGPAGNVELRAALQLPADRRDEEQVRVVRAPYERSSTKAAKKKAEPDPNVGELLVMKDLAQPRPTYIHLRGDFLRDDLKTGPLQPNVIGAVNAAFHQPPAKFASRLDLARWLVNPENPLTSRVTVNRTWMRYFGRGLVETEEDFGTQGTPPTYPELLDWLAREFMAHGWSMKQLHRLIVTSATYRQSSKARPDLVERDPRNLLLARQERVRLEAEIVRDAALSASGLLDPTIGGPSVHPPQAEGVYAFTQNTKKWVADTGGDRFRRAMYTTFYRAAPYPLFGTFDAPDFQTVCTRRARSNTPLQALTVANDPAFFEIAQGLAGRLLREGSADDPAVLVQRAFLLTLDREPSARETEILRGYFEQQQTALAADPQAAAALISPALKKIGNPEATAAATVCLARALLNTDSFITRE